MEKISALKFKEIRLLAVENPAIDHLAKDMDYAPVNYTQDELIDRPTWEYIDEFSHRAAKLMNTDVPFTYPELSMNPQPDIIGYRKVAI